MPIDSKHASNLERDARLRRQLLGILHDARKYSPSGGLSGPRLLAMSSAGIPSDMGFEDEDHFIALCRDLRNHELVKWKDEVRQKGERYAPRHFSLVITAKGSQLVEQLTDPIAGIDDERIAGDE